MLITPHIRGRFARLALAALVAAGCTGDSLVDPGSDTFTPPPLETFSGKVVLSGGSYKYLDSLVNPLMGLMWIKDQQVFNILNRNEDTPLNNAVMGLTMAATFPLSFEITIPQLPDTAMLMHWIKTEKTVTDSDEVLGSPGEYTYNFLETHSMIGSFGIAGIFLYNDTDRNGVYNLDLFVRGGDYYRPAPTDWMAGMSPDYCIMYIGNRSVLTDISKKNDECEAFELDAYGDVLTGIFGLRTGYNLVKVTHHYIIDIVGHPYSAVAGWRFDRVDDGTGIPVRLSDVRTGFELDWLVVRDRQ